MAYDLELEKRIEKAISDQPDLSPKKLFGGVCWLFRGNMAFGIWKDFLIVRLGAKEASDEAIAKGEALAFDVTGAPMKGWVMVQADKVKKAPALKKWITRGLDFAKSLPPK